MGTRDHLAPHEKLITPGHVKARKVLRVVGPIVFLLGLVLTAIGVLTVVAGDPFDHKLRAALPFIGMPLMFVGAVMSMAAFMGAVARYAASEQAPVAKDTINYMGTAAAPGVTAAATALGKGLREGFQEDEALATLAPCPACGVANDADAKFCDACGEALPDIGSCTACGTENDHDAKFCDGCGAALRES